MQWIWITLNMKQSVIEKLSVGQLYETREYAEETHWLYKDKVYGSRGKKN